MDLKKAPPASGRHGPRAASYPTRAVFRRRTDRKSTRLNSSHRCTSYAVFCLKIKRRGVTPEALQKFGLGLSDRGGQQLTRRFERQGVPEESMEESGLVLRRNDGSGFFDRFRG